MQSYFQTWATDTYQRSHDGVAVTIYQAPIPSFNSGTFSDAVLQLAAERAVSRGLSEIMLTWDDMPCAVCFEPGYCMLMAIDEATAIADGGCHSFAESDFLCRMDRNGEVYQEPSEDDSGDRNPFEGDFSSYTGPYAV